MKDKIYQALNKGEQSATLFFMAEYIKNESAKNCSMNYPTNKIIDENDTLEYRNIFNFVVTGDGDVIDKIVKENIKQDKNFID
jgi:hypothetical protein